MTEAEWLRTANAERMFNHLTGEWWGRLLASRFIGGVALFQRAVSPRKLFFLFDYHMRLVDPSRLFCVGQTEDDPADEWLGSGTGDDGIQKYARRAVLGQRSNPLLASVIRCLFGNPFRPVAIDAVWRTSTVAALARGIYAERAFDRLPVLADALQDAGCENADILDHCRGEGPHVRGCWVVDLLLGKG